MNPTLHFGCYYKINTFYLEVRSTTTYFSHTNNAMLPRALGAAQARENLNKTLHTN